MFSLWRAVTLIKMLPDLGSNTPAASWLLAKAIENRSLMPITSPVLRISGPKTISTPANLRKGNTASLIDTWAATAAGAFVLSENSLYTKQAWRVFQSKLSEQGILSVSRWYFRDGPAEMYRLTALAAAALQDAGVKHRVEWYPGAEHGFAFPQRACYDKPSAERHWVRLFDLFERNLRAPLLAALASTRAPEEPLRGSRGSVGLGRPGAD